MGNSSTIVERNVSLYVGKQSHEQERITQLLQKVQSHLLRSAPIGYGTLSKADKRLFKLILKGYNLEWPYYHVSRLLETDASFSCSLVEGSTIEGLNLSGSQAPHLEERKLFVVGVITSQPRVPDVFSRTPSYVDGSLYLADGTGTVPCVVASEVPCAAVNRVVLLTKWKYIVADQHTIQFLPAAHRALNLPRSVHVEVDQVLTCTTPVPPPLLDDTLTVKAFGQLSREEVRTAGKSKRLFAISGCVSAVSPVIRTGDEGMCFIQLMEESGTLSCEVVVKEPSLLHLSSTLHLHKDCLLTSLRIVFMKVDSKEEGAGDKRRVLCVTAATEVHQLGDQGEHNIGLTKQEERQHTSRSASKDKETVGRTKLQASVSTSDFVASLRGADSGEIRREKRGRSNSAKASPVTAKKKHKEEMLSVTVSEWMSKATVCPISSPSYPSVMNVSAADGSSASSKTHDTAPNEPRDLGLDASAAGASKEDPSKGISKDAVSHAQGQVTGQRQMINYQANLEQMTGWLCATSSDQPYMLAGLDKMPLHTQGTITKVLYPQAGVYELDNHIRLYLSHTPLCGAVHGLRVGASVVAYNVHFVEIPQLKMEGLCVCSKSCLRVVQFSSLSPQDGYLPFIPRRLSALALNQRVGGPELAWALHVLQQSQDKLRAVLMTPGTAPSPDHCWQGLLKLLSSKLAVKKRDCICEVFSSPHYCHVPTSHRWNPPYHVLYPDGINPALQETAKASGWREGCGSVGVAREGQGCNLPQWAYCQLESGQATPPLMLVGVVGGHKERGTMVLQDSQYSLELFVVTGNEGTESAPPLVIGQLVAVTNFTAIMERVTVQQRGKESDGKHWVTYHTCVCVNRRDVFVLGPDEKVQRCGREPAAETLSTGVSPPYCLVMYKSPLMLNSGQHPPSLQFTFTARMLMSEDVEALKQPPSSSTGPAVKEVTVQFHGTSVQHFSFVFPGCIYHLGHRSAKGKTPFFGELGRCLIFGTDMMLYPLGISQGAMNSITKGAKILSIGELQPVIDWRAPPAGVTDQPQSHMVSFTGTLLARSYKQDMKKCKALQGGMIGGGDVIEMGTFRGSLEEFDALKICSAYLTHELELKVADTSSCAVIMVYCCLISHSQPTWLIPGMRIELRNFLLEKSARYDNTYCKHCPQSEMRPVGLPDSEMGINLSSSSDLQQEMAAGNSLPLTNIYRVFQKLTALELKRTPLMVMGSVVHVQQVSFVYNCELCRQAIVGSQCRPACNGPRGKVKVEARCLFSDGSGECMLFCAGKLVQTVLNLSQLDWTGFNQTVAESGQLVYNRPNRFTQKMDLPRQDGPPPKNPMQTTVKPTSAVDLLAQKAVHPSVHRPLKVVVQPFFISTDLLYPGQPKTRQISLGSQSQLNVLVLPKLQLRALHVEPVNYITEAALLLRSCKLKPSLS